MQKTKQKFMVIVMVIMTVTGCKEPEITPLTFRSTINCIELLRNDSITTYAFNINEGLVVELSSLTQNGKEKEMTLKGVQVEFVVNSPEENIVLQAEFKSGYQAIMLFDPTNAQFLGPIEN